LNPSVRRNPPGNLLHRLRERGVIRVAASYAVIAWLALQIADVTVEPLGLPRWVMTALILAAVAGFPLALAFAWFLELGEQGVTVDTAAEGVPRPSTRGLRHYADAIVIGILLVAVVVLLVRQSDLGKPKPPANPAIAVLPFENLSGDPEQDYFSDGLAEETLDRLGRVPGLKVIARASSFGFRGQNVDAKTIAEKLGVTTLLEGSVRRDGQRLMLNARLIDGATGQQVWSGSFDRELQDIFAVQAELAAAIVEAIVPTAKGSPAESSNAPTVDLSAYDLYLAAKMQLVMRTEESIDKSMRLAEQAVALDPGFASAQAQLANSLLFKALWSENDTPEQVAAIRRRAEAAVHKALALDPDLSEAHGAYANLLRDSGRPGAEEQYRRALELNPNNAASWHDYAVFLGGEGKEAESDQATARALELDPRQPVTWANYLDSVSRKGRARFEAELARAIRTVGDMPGAVDRFPFAAWTKDRDDYRKAILDAMRVLAEHDQTPPLLLLPGAVVPGFPRPLMQAALAAARHNRMDDAPAWVYRYRAWYPVDLERARQALTGDIGQRRQVNLAAARRYNLVEVAGLAGDWQMVDQALDDVLANAPKSDPRAHAVVAFWRAVQGRYEDAARSLALAEPVPMQREGPALGASLAWGQMDTAIVRILRATGRGAEADRRAAEALKRLQPPHASDDEPCHWSLWESGPVAYAGLAANEGLKSEAVRALRLAMLCGDLPFGFWPHLAWFKSLEGYAPYDELLRERSQRIESLRAELLGMEAEATTTADAAR
jgi:TolB-like protein